MSITLILNVLIGLFFAWTVMSLTSMQVQEWLAARLKWRSRMLEKTIGKMLTDITLVDQFYNHPLIRSLYTGKNNSDKPSYIPDDQFSQAMIDILAATGTEASILQQQLYKLYSQAGNLTGKKRKDARRQISQMLGMVRKALVSEAGEDACSEILDSVKNDLVTLGKEMPRFQTAVDNLFDTVRVQKQQINDALAKLSVKENASSNLTMNRIEAGVTALSITQPQLKQTLQAILNSVPQTVWQQANELELVRMNLEEWFNNTMDRLTGWYKRRCIITTLFVGILLATIVNVDSVNLTTRLWREPDLRIAILNKVETILTEDTTEVNSSDLATIQQEFSDINLPIGWLGSPVTIIDENNALNLHSVCNIFPRNENQIFGLVISNQCYPIINAPSLFDPTGGLMKLAGILASGIAASPGASFWFDLLKKVINVRLTGAKPSELSTSVG